MERTVGADLELTVHEDCDLELQVAVARSAGLALDEDLTILVGGEEVAPVEVTMPHGGRLHQATLPPGPCRISYRATVRGEPGAPPVDPADLVVQRRPSRYIESDTFGGFAESEFAGLDGAELLQAVSSWVGTRLTYVPGSSGPTDGATETLLGGAGVCRDYAHLVIALLRALGTPARLAAVYAPGCDPMDFHAVAEAYVAGGWYVVDATALAPRTSLLRIATGRDAADTAFMTTTSGRADLDSSVVTAVAVDGLPDDDLDQLVALG